MEEIDREAIEKHNVEVFEKYGTDNSGEERHICTECGRKVCIDGSASNRGHNLLCNACFHRHCRENDNFMKEFYKW